MLTANAGLIAAPGFILWIKRVIDVVASIVFLLLFSPVLILTAVAVAMTSRGPIIFKQERVGKDGRPFLLFKFRSMRATAEDERDGLDDQNELSGPIFKIYSDPRITCVGKFIRRASIAELPQFLNVLRGDMSLVGPRPPLPDEVDLYTEWQLQRLAVRPGVTGLSQVSGRANLDFLTSVTLDIEYIEEWRPLLDTMLLLKTIPAVLLGRGAY